jgi:hypothetical protein
MIREKLIAHYERAGRAIQFRNREISTGPLRFLSYLFLVADIAAIVALVRLRLQGRRQRIAMESLAA